MQTLFLAMLLLGGQSQAQQMQFQSRYDEMTRGLKAGSMAAFEKYLAPGYVLKKETGKKLDRKAVITGTAQQMKMLKDLRWPRHIVNLNVTPNGAVAIVDEGFTAKMAPPKGPFHAVQMIATSRDTWTKTAFGMADEPHGNSEITVQGRREGDQGIAPAAQRHAYFGAGTLGNERQTSRRVRAHQGM